MYSAYSLYILRGECVIINYRVYKRGEVVKACHIFTNQMSLAVSEYRSCKLSVTSEHSRPISAQRKACIVTSMSAGHSFIAVQSVQEGKFYHVTTRETHERKYREQNRRN